MTKSNNHSLAFRLDCVVDDTKEFYHLLQVDPQQDMPKISPNDEYIKALKDWTISNMINVKLPGYLDILISPLTHDPFAKPRENDEPVDMVSFPGFLTLEEISDCVKMDG